MPDISQPALLETKYLNQYLQEVVVNLWVRLHWNSKELLKGQNEWDSGHSFATGLPLLTDDFILLFQGKFSGGSVSLPHRSVSFAIILSIYSKTLEIQ